MAVQTGSLGLNQHFVSYFDVMPDALFAAYQARGLQTRSDVIVSKAERDAHPFNCKGDSEDSFIYPPDYNENGDSVYLTGYKAPENKGSGNAPSSQGKAPQNTTDAGGQDDMCEPPAGQPKPPTHSNSQYSIIRV